jgi:Xaa-Pro aminopeptidase
VNIERSYPAIPEADYRHRKARLQAQLEMHELRGAVLLNRANVAWLTGFRPSIIAPNMAFIGAYLPDDGEARLVGMPGLANLMRETAWGLVDTVDSAEAAIAALAGMAGQKGRIGVEWSMGQHRAADACEIKLIEATIGEDRLVDVSAQIWDCRMIKTVWETTQYRRLGEITAAGFRAGLNSVKAGVHEYEISRAMWGAMVSAGADVGPNCGQLMVRSGRERYPVFCGAPTRRIVARGDQVMLAGGPVYNGYHIDIHRFANVGPLGDIQARLYNQSRQGLEAALSVIRPGVTTGDVFAAASKAMRAVAATDQVPWRVFGHGIGLENYEYPMISEGGSVELSEGMALAIEIPAYDVPEFRVLGAFLEECVLVTATGVEILTAGVSRDLHLAND